MSLGTRLLVLASIIGIVIFAYFKKPSIHSHTSISLEKLSEVKNIVPVVVIGSGPAGLSTALYTARMNLYTVLFKGTLPGGQLTGTSYIENWPGVGTKLGPQLMKEFEKHVESFGARLSTDSVERVDFSKWPYKIFSDEGQEINALTVIIATGSLPKRLNIKGESEYWGKGVSTCAVCDAPFYKDSKVVVVGGGDSAAEEAIELSRVAKEVTIFVRGAYMRASAIMQQRLKEYSNIIIRYNIKISEIIGDGSRVTQIKIVDESGKESTITIDGLFLGIGHEPNTKLFTNQLATDKLGYVVMTAPPSQLTSKSGIFAAGDVADYKYRQAGVAAGDGIKAALDAVAFLRDSGFNDKITEKIENQYYEPHDLIAAVKIPVLKNSADYNKETSGEKRPIVIDFYAQYCPSCMQMIPIYEAVASRMHEKIKFLKVDVEHAPDLAKRFDVPKIPTMLVLKEGKLLSRSTETMSKRKLTQYLEQFIEHKK